MWFWSVSWSTNCPVFFSFFLVDQKKNCPVSGNFWSVSGNFWYTKKKFGRPKKILVHQKEIWSTKNSQRLTKNSLRLDNFFLVDQKKWEKDRTIGRPRDWPKPHGRDYWILQTKGPNPWNFHEKILRIGGAKKWGVFEAANLNLFLQKKNCFI